MSKAYNPLHDPKYVGPGAWWVLHTAAADAKSNSDIEHVLWMINLYARRFACVKCRKHFAEFIKADPPKNYISEPLGLFYWTFQAHNNANIAASRPQMSYEDAKTLYFGPNSTCTAECGALPLPTDIPLKQSTGYIIAPSK
jgi:hypothetical protein